MGTTEGSENLIAYCGLYCGDCHGYQQKIPDLARDLRKELRQSKYKKFADFLGGQSFGKAFQNYDKCYEVLGAMVRFRCHRGVVLEGDLHSVRCDNAARKKDIKAAGNVLISRSATSLIS